MEYISDRIQLDKDFPFSIFYADSSSPYAIRNGKLHMHNHSCLEINLALSSGGTYYIGENIYPIRKNDLFIINNYEYHFAFPDSEDMKLLVIVFDPEMAWHNDGMDYLYLKAFYEWKDGFHHRLAAEDVPEAIIGSILEMEKEWHEKATGYPLVIKSLLLRILALIYRRFDEMGDYAEKVVRFQKEYARIIEVTSYIDKSFTKPIELATLADMVHMNQNYFSTYFHNAIGCSVITYIIRRRLKHACMKLATTSDSIMEIAFESGFASVAYFNRTFKKHMHMTPSEYRKNAPTLADQMFSE